MHRKNGSGKAFYFKQFHIQDYRCAMKVGSDGVLLGAWAKTEGAHRILDIGTGSGLIALMLAQRTSLNASITGIEINEDAFGQACINVNESPWAEKVKAVHSSIQNFEAELGYDLIVSNPPYFEDSLRPSDKGRTQSRHTSDLSFPELLAAVKRLLLPNGHFCLVLPAQEGVNFIKLAAKSSLFCSKKLIIKFKQSKPAIRILLEFTHQSLNCFEEDLILCDENGKWSESYVALVSPFYLWA